MEDFTVNLIAFDFICYTERTEDTKRDTEKAGLFATRH